MIGKHLILQQTVVIIHLTIVIGNLEDEVIGTEIHARQVLQHHLDLISILGKRNLDGSCSTFLYLGKIGFSQLSMKERRQIMVDDSFIGTVHRSFEHITG